MKNLLTSKFLDKIKARIGPYQPKFQAGDILLNDINGLIIITEVKKVLTEGYSEKEIGRYCFLDIRNDHSKKGTVGKSFLERYRDIRAIDATYIKIKKEVAQILYCKKVQE